MHYMFVVGAFFFPISTCFITRLPSCKMHGNFSSKQDSYFESNSDKESFHNITRENCTFKCIVHSNCMFANHKMENSICELLLVSRVGTLVVKPGWRFLSTDYTNVMQKGPMCENNSLCRWGWYCQDTCEDKGFLCFNPDRNIAARGVATQSTTYSYYVAERAIDGDETTVAITNNKPNDWWQLDLLQNYKIEVLSILFENYANVHVGCQVTVSTEANIVTFMKAIAKVHEYSFYCGKQGRYIKIGGGCLNKNHMWIYEVKVFEE